jgi:2-polyprenyl-6-methoxyphenol hydroxylase-like FAD-dependent oxidoreductase
MGVWSGVVEKHDAVIVGARCAGSTLATALAQRGWDVALVDRDTFPSTTVSTHLLYPNTLARLERLGVLDTLRSQHELVFSSHRLVALGHEIAGRYTPIDGFDLGLAPRRIALDKAGVDTALAAGVTGIFGSRAVDLLGAGTGDDPVRGVRLSDGREFVGDWVFGADGRGSMVAGKLGLEKEREQRGELAFSYSYWSGIPVDEPTGTLQINLDEMLYHGPVEDGLYLVIANGVPDLAQGTKAERERKYMEAIRRFPETFDPKLLDEAEMVTEVTVAPETLMRGFYRTPTGPGWALVGDASYFKHPGTAQGIGDAVEAALYVADSLSASGGTLGGYEEWRDAKSAEHYDWSFAWGRFPDPEAAPALFGGWASDPDAGQDLRDCLARTVEPSQLMSRERLERWFAPA